MTINRVFNSFAQASSSSQLSKMPRWVISAAACCGMSCSLLSGCATGVLSTATPAVSNGIHLTGTVHGGQQPLSFSTIQLYSYDTTNGFTALIATPPLSDATGNFSITLLYACPTANTPVFLTATGGNPGLALGTNNPAIFLAAALGDCGTLSASTRIVLNEVTTVAFAAEYSDITSANTSTDVEAAFLKAAMLANYVNGMSPGAGQTSTDNGGNIPSTEINTLANIVSTCVNSNGSTDSTTPCGKLFALTPDAVGGMAPTDIFGALTNLEASPYSYDTDAIFALAPATPPFVPELSTAPSNWGIVIGYIGTGLLNAAPDAGKAGDTVVITSNNPSVTAQECPFTPPLSISFGSGLEAEGTFTSSTITVTVPAGVSGNVTGEVITSVGYCTFPFYGQAISAYTVSPTMLNFATQATGTQSGSQQVVFTNNNGSAPTELVNAAALTSSPINSFVLTTDNCSNKTIPQGSTCSVYVAFTPGSSGATTGTLTFYVHGAAIGSATLSGTGN